MVPHRTLHVAIVAIFVHLVRAEAEHTFSVFGPGETPAYADITGPIIFHNLTKSEFMDRLTVHSQVAALRKRDVYGREDRNNPEQQIVVDLRTKDCQDAWPGRPAYRAIGGQCIDNLWGGVTGMRVFCKQPPDVSASERKKTGHGCDMEHPCDTLSVWRYGGLLTAKMPYCANEIKVNRAQDHDQPITYEGMQAVPDLTNPDWRDSSAGTVQKFNTFYQVETPFKEIGGTGHRPDRSPERGRLTAKWEYRGHWPSTRETFRHDSQGMTNSWSCIGCPAGYLYVITYGFTAAAIGFSFPATIIP